MLQCWQPLPHINDVLMMNIIPFQIKGVIIFFGSYYIWLIKWWFFFSNLGFTCVDEFYWFYVFYNINNIYFFQFGNLSLWSMTHLWWFWDIYKSILLWLVFCWFFFKGSSRIFSFQLMQKVAFFCGITY